MKPMLASDAPAERVFPLYASPKLDGIRCVIKDGVAVSRSLKPLPNAHIQEILGHPWLNGLDGEITVGPANHPNVMQATTSGVMSRDGKPEFTFWVFDYWINPTSKYSHRYATLQFVFNEYQLYQDHAYVRVLEHRIIHSEEELLEYEQEILDQGFEGVMLRTLDSPYKYGRSTSKQGYLLKLKRFKDSEAVILGYEERMHNANEAKLDNLGYTERSSCKEGLVPMGTLGALVVKDCKTGVEFKVGTGFDDVQRQSIWDRRDTLVDHIIKYKYFETGVKEKPRFPVWLGFRNKEDMCDG